MDQLEAAALIGGYESLRQRCANIARAGDGSGLGEYQWLRNAIYEGDIAYMNAAPEGVECFGSTWSNQTCSTESFEFTVPWEALT